MYRSSRPVYRSAILSCGLFVVVDEEVFDLMMKMDKKCSKMVVWCTVGVRFLDKFNSYVVQYSNGTSLLLASEGLADEMWEKKYTVSVCSLNCFGCHTRRGGFRVCLSLSVSCPSACLCLCLCCVRLALFCCLCLSLCWAHIWSHAHDWQTRGGARRECTIVH